SAEDGAPFRGAARCVETSSIELMLRVVVLMVSLVNVLQGCALEHGRSHPVARGQLHQQAGWNGRRPGGIAYTEQGRSSPHRAIEQLRLVYGEHRNRQVAGECGVQPGSQTHGRAGGIGNRETALVKTRRQEI